MNCGAWLGWQIDYLLYLQNLRDVTHHVFDNFFLIITMFGEVMIPVVVICTLYWTINKKIGQFVLWSYFMGFVVNQIAKTTACIYRPWILDSRVHPLAQAIPAATGYSFPSGHTAGAVATWGGCAVSFWKNKLIRYICIAIVLCVMFSRNYVGVHTPQDVIVSFVLSCFVLFGVYKIIKWTEQDEKRDKYVILGVFAATILTVLYTVFRHYPVDYLFGKVLYYPTQVKYEIFARSGFIFGALTGWFAEKRHIDFNPENGAFFKKVVRLLLGLTVIFGLNTISGIFKGMISTNLSVALSGMFVQHLLIGLFITCIYPFIVKKYNL